MKYFLIPFLFAACRLGAQPAQDVHLELTWTDNSTGETGFVIERSTDGVNYGDIGRSAPDVTVYVDTVAPGGVKLWYRVRAIDEVHNLDSAPSAPATYTPAPQPTPTPTPLPPKPPGKPTGLKVKKN